VSAGRGRAGSEIARRLEAWLVVLVALHSFAVAVFLLFFTEWGVRFGGWSAAEPLFFARQAGVFHVVVAVGYLLEYFRYRGVSLLVTTKTIAVVFLGSMFLVDGGPWAVPLSAAGDAAMAVVVFAVHRLARQAD